MFSLQTNIHFDYGIQTYLQLERETIFAHFLFIDFENYWLRSLFTLRHIFLSVVKENAFFVALLRNEQKLWDYECKLVTSSLRICLDDPAFNMIVLCFNFVRIVQPDVLVRIKPERSISADVVGSSYVSDEIEKWLILFFFRKILSIGSGRSDSNDFFWVLSYWMQLKSSDSTAAH